MPMFPTHSWKVLSDNLTKSKLDKMKIKEVKKRKKRHSYQLNYLSVPKRHRKTSLKDSERVCKQFIQNMCMTNMKRAKYKLFYKYMKLKHFSGILLKIW